MSRDSLIDEATNSLSRQATIDDVARAVGVSKMTVSRVLSGKSKASPHLDAIRRVTAELGYEINPHAQRLSSGHAQNLIGLFSLNLDLGVGTAKIEQIQTLLSERGYEAPIYSYSYVKVDAQHQRKLLSTLRRQRPRAIVCFTSYLHETSLDELQRYVDEGGALVCYDYAVPIECDQVIFDREHNEFIAAHHLLDLGHRDLGFYQHGSTHGPGQPKTERQKGFERALREQNLPLREEWIFHGGLYEEGGRHAAREYLKLQVRPTAMCIPDDTAAAAFIAEVRSAGLIVPGDVSIVAHGDRPIARLGAVQLTTTEHPVDQIAQSVVELLESRLQKNQSVLPRKKVITSGLIQRQSAAARA